MSRTGLCRTAQPPATSVEEARERQIERLPALASDLYFQGQGEDFGWTPTLKTLMEGTDDENSVLHLLRGLRTTLIRYIYTYVASEWAKHITLTIPASCVGKLAHGPTARFINGRRGQDSWSTRETALGLPSTSRPFSFPQLPIPNDTRRMVRYRKSEEEVAAVENQEPRNLQGYVAFATCGTLQFPEPNDRNVNMLPFIFGDKSSLPLELQCYHDLIEKCPYKNATSDETGKIGYLTVHESLVQARSAQRREGLHIEAPGSFETDACSFTAAEEHSWGLGHFYGPDQYEGGIYMASSVSNTSEVWDALVDKNVKGIVDKHGNCEHLRKYIGPGTKLQANQLIWMTDCTPHEALLQEFSGYRQFVRVVTSHVTHWFAQHSTPNPLVPVPDNVTVVTENKFD